MKKLSAVLVSAGLAIGALVTGVSPANAVPGPKVCYYDNETELKYTLNVGYYGGLGFMRTARQDVGPQIKFPKDITLDSAKFSGDCPSNAQPSSTDVPPYFMYRDLSSTGSYYQGGVVKYWTPLQQVLSDQGGIRWVTDEQQIYGYEMNLGIYSRYTGFNTEIGQREAEPYLTYSTFGFNGAYLNKWVTLRPTAQQTANAWSGNAATENCAYEADDCPGGYTMANYVIMPKNPISVKWKSYDTNVTTKVGKKSGSRVTVTVNVDRFFTATSGKDVKSYPGDVVTIKRGSKVVGTAKVNKNGVAKLRIKDIKGANTYTVTVPETNRNWDGLATFVK